MKSNQARSWEIHEGLTEESQSGALTRLQLSRVELDNPFEQLRLVFLMILADV